MIAYNKNDSNISKFLFLMTTVTLLKCVIYFQTHDVFFFFKCPVNIKHAFKMSNNNNKIKLL